MAVNLLKPAAETRTFGNDQTQNIDMMDSGEDYDQMLKAMFDSCDSVGLGLLAPNDFEKLCEKLSIEEHCRLLSQVLYPETSKRKLLSYETFRDTLILFLTGDPTFEENLVSDIVHTEQTDWVGDCADFCDDGDGSVLEIHSKLKTISDDDEKVFVGRNHETFNSSYIVNSTSIRKSTSKRKYGRTSTPDVDLLGDRFRDQQEERPIVLREIQVPNPDTIDNSTPNSPWKGDNVNFVKENKPPNIMKEEQFTGMGNDDHWKNPDSEWMTEMNATPPNRYSSTVDTPSMKAVKNDIELAWSRVVGDPMVDALKESQLGYLCEELGLCNSFQIDDLSQLFAALDADGDGYVMYHEFSEQMSCFLGKRQSDEVEPIETVYTDSKQDENYQNQDFCDFQPGWEEKLDNYSRSTVEKTSTPSYFSPYGKFVDSDGDNTDYDGRSIHARDDSSSPEVSTNTQPQSGGQLSLDNDTSPLCPPVVAVEPGQLADHNRGRRRRHTSAAIPSKMRSRSSKKRVGRSIPLPHYHPATIKKMEELPLSFLAEADGRYVSFDTLRSYLENDGFEECSRLLDAFQISSTEQNISIEALSDFFEMEAEQNLIFQAALILLKQGLNYHRSRYLAEMSERCKKTNNNNHLMSQLQESESRFEKLESQHKREIKEMKSKYKQELFALSEQLTTAQEKLKENETSSSESMTKELATLSEEYKKSQDMISSLELKVKALTQQKEHAESELRHAKEALEDMGENLDVVCQCLELASRESESRKLAYAQLLKFHEDEQRTVQDNYVDLASSLQKARNSLPRYKSANSSLETVSGSESPTPRNTRPSRNPQVVHESPQLPTWTRTPSVYRKNGFVPTAPMSESSANVVDPTRLTFLTPSPTRAKSKSTLNNKGVENPNV